MVVAARFLWGLGAGAPRTLAAAIIRDRYEGNMMARLMSLIMAVFMLAPIVAPMLGAGLIELFPWQSVFWFPVILAPGEATKTLTLGSQVFIGQFVTDWDAVLSALSLAILPVLVLYVLFSRQRIRGITSGAVK